MNGIMDMTVNDIPGPGKFEGNPSDSLAHYLYDLGLTQGADEFFGFVDELGWYGLFRNMDKPNTEAFLHQEFGTQPEVHWHYIVSEDTQGFFTYTGYNDLDEVNKAWETLVAEKSVAE